MTTFPAFDGRQKCAGANVANFYIEDSYGRLPAAVKAVCNGCPFVEPCGEWGLHHEHWGLWGGLDERDRQAIRKLRGISASVPVMRIVEGIGQRRGPKPRKAS